MGGPSATANIRVRWRGFFRPFFCSYRHGLYPTHGTGHASAQKNREAFLAKSKAMTVGRLALLLVAVSSSLAAAADVGALSLGWFAHYTAFTRIDKLARHQAAATRLLASARATPTRKRFSASA